MLDISSSVEIKTLKLTNKAEQDTKPLKGATIALYQGSTLVKQAQSSTSGDFSVLVPADGEFMIVVSYPGCNPKKFYVSTKNVPETFDKEGWEPSFPIGGVIMARPLYSIDYSALREPMVKVIFKQKGKVFDDDGDYTDEVLGKLRKIKADEDDLIARFLEAVQAGDAALKKPDCPLAKAMYEKALGLIPNEEYPIAQLAKVGDCLVEKEKQDKIVAAESDGKKQEEAAKQKVKDQRKALEVAQAEKFAKEKNAERLRQKEEAQKRETPKVVTENKASGQLEPGSEKARAEKKPASPAGREATVMTGSKAKKKTVEAGRKEQSAAPVLSSSAKSGASHEEGGKVKAKKTHYSIPQVIGTSQYQKLVAEADEKFDKRDYVQAKALYNKALGLKPSDAHATGRLDEIRKLESAGKEK
jgi:hypothetical protein